MTASASVVEAVLLMKLKELIREQSEGEWTGEMIEKDAHVFAVALSSLFTPQPAEQDAREAVARVERFIREWARGLANGDMFYGLHAGDEREAHLSVADLRTILALTQAAPDGWVLVPVEPTEAMLAAGESAAWDDGNSMPAIRAMPKAWSAMLSASPAPPAQGAGG